MNKIAFDNNRKQPFQYQNGTLSVSFFSRPNAREVLFKQETLGVSRLFLLIVECKCGTKTFQEKHQTRSRAYKTLKTRLEQLQLNETFLTVI